MFSFFISSETRSFVEQPLNLSASVEDRSPNSSYYVDLDSDCTAEIVLFYNLHGNRSLEVFKRDSKVREFLFQCSLEVVQLFISCVSYVYLYLFAVKLETIA